MPFTEGTRKTWFGTGIHGDFVGILPEAFTITQKHRKYPPNIKVLRPTFWENLENTVVFACL
jgi:hypothetical protein